MDLALKAETQRLAWTRCILVRLDLPAGPACFADSGLVAFNSGDGSRVYYSHHPTFGFMDGVPSGMGSNTGGQNTRVQITFLPRSAEAMDFLSDALNQGSKVRVWYGAVDPVTGDLIGAPELRFEGLLDTPQMTVGRAWSLTWECGTEADLQLEANSDWRLNHSFQQATWPGDTGLINVSEAPSATRTQEWRS